MVGPQRRTLSWSLALGALWLLIGLNRFDGFVLVGIFVTWQVLFRRELWPAVPALLVFVVGLAAYNAWRYSYYVLLLPNTGTRRLGHRGRWSGGDAQGPDAVPAAPRLGKVNALGLLVAGVVVLGTSTSALIDAWRSDFTGPGRHFSEHEAKLIGEQLHTVIP